MNKVILCGRPTTDPVVTQLPNSENKAARFTLAVDRKRRGAEGQSNADFPRIQCYGKQVDFIEKYIKRGDIVSVVGRLQTGSYNDKAGNKVYYTDVIADSVELVYSKNNATVNAEAANDEQDAKPVMGNFVEMDDDDDELPFN